MKVLVLRASALHLGFLGCYGNQWVLTPNLDRLATTSVVFDQHYADTPGAGRTCWTGRYRFPLPPGEEVTPPQEPPDLPRLLEAGGVTVAVTGGGGSAGEEPAEDDFWEPALADALDTLDRLADREHWLAWVELPSLAPPWPVPEEFLEHYFPQGAEEDEEDEETLEPWTDPVPGLADSLDDIDRERIQNTYAAAVSYCDAQLGEFLDALEEGGLLDEVLLCFTADLGLPLGEHGVLGACPPRPHDELIHLPLLLRLPGGAEGGRRVFALTQPVDLAPTLLETFGLPVPAGVQGRSLGPLLRGEAERVRAYACCGMGAGEEGVWALRTPEWGFLLPAAGGSGRPQLFVKPDDRWEVNDLLQHHLELAEHLEETLRGFVRATRQPGPLQPPELRDVEEEPAEGRQG